MNAILKCVRCHKYGMLAWHQSPLSAALRFIRKFPARAEYLRGVEVAGELERDWTIEDLQKQEQFLKEKLEGMDK